MNIFYYDNEKNIYHSKLDAINAAKKGKFVNFYFYDKEFTQVDWKTEPPESLSELYKQRAQKIRDDYEHVIICYSGGVDSTNILESFYYNNIHIDEIVMVGAFSQDSYAGSDENHNGDVFHNAKPTLNNLHLPNTKISTFDYTDWFRDPNNFTLIKTYGDEWTKYIGAWQSVHHLWWYDFKKFVGKNNNKKTCWIMGSEKPQFSPNYPASTCFVDLGCNDYGGNYVNENFTRVNFYNDIDPTAVRVMLKQNHLLMKFQKEYEKYGKNAVIDLKGEQLIAKVIYDLKNPILFHSKKSISHSISSRDMFMLNKTDSDMYKMFLLGLNAIKKYKSVNEKTSFFSRKYYLE